MRLIDAEVAEEIIWKRAQELRDEGNPALGGALAAAIGYLDKCPTIDAVPVVRCKECEHWNNACCGLGTGDCHVLERITFGTFFCSYGERKEG